MKKNKLINYLKTGILFFGISILLWNCEKQETNFYSETIIPESLVKVITMKQFKKENNKSSILSDISENLDTKKTYYTKGSKNENKIVVSTNKILKVDKGNIITYSFGLEKPTSESSDFENFMIFKYIDKSYKFIILKYQYTDNEEEPFNIKYNEISADELKNFDYLKPFLERGPELADCISVSHWCPSGGTRYHEKEVCGSGTGTTETILDFSNCFNLGSVDTGGPVDSGDDDFGDNENTDDDTGGSNGNNTGGSGAVNIPLERSDLEVKVKRISGVLNLNDAEREWLNNENEETILGIEAFLDENDNSNDAKTLVKEAINFLEVNPQYSFSYLLNNRTPFDTINGEGEGYQEGGFDNTLYSSFNPQQLWTNISPIINKSQFVGWGHKGIKRDCMAYSKEQLKVMGFQISSYLSKGQTFQVYTAQNGVNNTQLTEGLDYLNYALSNNIPVIVGVDKVPGSSNPGTDNTTDHFVVVVGRGSDSKGNYFQFYDNASSIVNDGTNSSNKLYYNSTNGIISGNSQTGYGKGSTYTLTMIRKSKSL